MMILCATKMLYRQLVQHNLSGVTFRPCQPWSVSVVHESALRAWSYSTPLKQSLWLKQLRLLPGQAASVGDCFTAVCQVCVQLLLSGWDACAFIPGYALYAEMPASKCLCNMTWRVLFVICLSYVEKHFCRHIRSKGCYLMLLHGSQQLRRA